MTTLAERVVAVHHALADAGLPHAFGGALALAYYGEPRATIDIDVNVFVPPDERHRVVAALAPLGAVPAPRVDLDRDGWEQLRWDHVPIDVFYSYDPLHDAMQRGAREHPFLGELLPFLAAEHLVACKAIFDRPKDWPDIEQVLFATDDLDVDEARRWVAQFVGVDDERYQRLDAAVTELRG
jgi:hypothetical protein